MDFRKPSTTPFRRMRDSALFSQRSLLTLMAVTGLVNACLIRLCLNLTILYTVRDSRTKMVSRTYPHFYQNTKSTMMDGTQIVEFSVFQSMERSDVTDNYLIKLAFFIAYALLHIPGAFLVQKYGGKMMFNLGLFSSAVCALLAPIVVQNGGADGLIMLRYFIGIGETVVYSALMYLLSCWIPKNERARVSSIVFCGGQIGSMLCNFITGLARETIAGYFGAIFYALGVLGVLWNVAFHFLVFNSPSSHPRISVTEMAYLRKEIGNLAQTKTFCQIPWTNMISSPPVVVLMIVQLGHDWGFYILASEVPNYLRVILKASYAELAWYTSIPFMVNYLFSVSCGIVSDHIVNRELVTRKRARKIFTAIGAFVTAAFTLLIYVAEYNKIAAVVYYTLAMGFMGAYYAGAQANLLDLCPNYSGALMGFVSGTGAICGYFAPLLTIALTRGEEYWHWGAVYWTSFTMLFITLVTYFKWASGEVQPWNDNVDHAKRVKESMQRNVRSEKLLT